MDDLILQTCVQAWKKINFKLTTEGVILLKDHMSMSEFFFHLEVNLGLRPFKSSIAFDEKNEQSCDPD